MGIFDFFRKNEKSQNGNAAIPEELSHLIYQSDFNSILAFASVHLKEKAYKNISYADGLLTYEHQDEHALQHQTNFVNLVKHVICEEKKNWQNATVDYLENLTKDQDNETEILLDFEKAKAFLTVRLQSASNYEDEQYQLYLETLVYKVHIPETYTVLALDLPTRFHLLTIEDTNPWGIDKNALFEIAHKNLLDKIEEIQAQQHHWDGADIYTLFDRDYSAAYCTDFANSCSTIIGEKGSMVSFPTRGSVFIHPITTKESFNVAFHHIVQKTNQFFADDPGPISRNIYWFNDDRFILFGLSWNDGEISYNIPEELYDLLDG